MSTEDPEFIPTIKQLYADLEQHMRVEEEEDLAKLENAIQTAESESLAASFAKTKYFVPSRSHPSAPNRPPFETAISLLAAPFDKVADLFRRFPKD
jgi:hypothetical protein